MQYIKIFSHSQAAILALKSNTVTSSLVKQTIITLNTLADSTIRVEINWIKAHVIWSEWRLTVIAATVRIALVDILDLSEVDIPAGGFLYPAVGWGRGW